VTSCDEKSDEAASVLAAMNKHPGVIDSVGLACTTITPDGKLTSIGERAKLVARLHKASARSSLVIANVGPNGFDGPLAKKILDGEASRVHLLELILDAAMRDSFRDVELDLEAMSTKAAANYAKLTKLAVARVKNGEVVVDVHPKTTDTHTWDGPGGHDYAALGDAGAVIRLMTYDLSTGPGVPPGPSTRATWAREVIKYARSKGIPAERLELGLPAYGYDFPPKGKGAPIALRHADVMELQAKTKAEIKRDEHGTPHFDYDGHQVWFDDAESIKRLLAELADMAPEVRGVAIWGFGRADANLGKLLADLGF
jgi:spore germination protein YaaH